MSGRLSSSSSAYGDACAILSGRSSPSVSARDEGALLSCERAFGRACYGKSRGSPYSLPLVILIPVTRPVACRRGGMTCCAMLASAGNLDNAARAPRNMSRGMRLAENTSRRVRYLASFIIVAFPRVPLCRLLSVR